MDSEIKNLIEKHSLRHIAIIMDGNGRWAVKQGKERPYGHKFGTERVIDVIRHSSNLGIKYLSLYAFSTENWKRPKTEVSTIMDLLVKFINRELDEMVRENVKLRIMGDIKDLPLLSRKAVEYAINKTKNNDGLILNIGLNYGSRAEIVKAVKSIAQDYKDANILLEDIDQKLISKKLYTDDMPDPDLLIRTGGEMRVSNFMLYQIAYTELFVTDVLWPDFSPEELDKAIMEFFRRNRRFGGVNV
ncbi:MAG: isoprenyl transferase [Tissierellia bacterium]|nr:isoprenyl transferase [Tissierellia bacterium]